MNPQDQKYIHGTAPEEQKRLSKLNQILNERSLRGLDIRLGERVLDLGCGLSQLTRGMARRAGSDGVVIGIEASAEQIDEAKRQAAQAGEEDLIEIRQGLATDLPLRDQEWGSFDVAHARFLLEHVADPRAAVRQMFRAVRPGGRIVLEDDDHDVLRLWPTVVGFDALWQGYVDSYSALGFDPYIGRRLVGLLVDAGASATRNDWKFFGGCNGAYMFEELVENFVGIVHGARDTILSATSVDEESLERTLDAFRAWSKLPGASMWYGTFWAEGVKGERGATPLERPMMADTARAPARTLDKLTATRFLADSARDLNSSLQLDDVYQRIAERVHDLVDCHLFCVLLWSEQAQLLEFNYSTCFGVHLPQEGGFRLGQGLCGTAALQRAPIRVDNVLKDDRYVRHRHPEVEIRSELVVPLIVGERVIGVVDLESTEFGAFSAETEELMLALSRHIAIAVDNAQLYEKVLADDQRKESELATARAIQRELLPARPPQIPGVDIGLIYAPARALAGDFYDLLPLEDGRLAFAVGDVAGKSTPAALYGSFAVGILRGQALRQIHEPERMLERMNEDLCRVDIDQRFVAMVYGVLEPRSKRLSLSNAGFPFPYLVRGKKLSSLHLPGFPLGLFPGTTYTSATETLQSGDTIVFCSDGFMDCENGSGEAFGEARLIRFIESCAELSAQEIAAALTRVTDEFSGSEFDHTDDRTAVILRIE
jgi:serine phosphatase RsbU (regulator of sigma subunit)/ubiquinone/menaquinone biosynthesis C-methylase UbiE